jgi:Acyl-coenzyme A:6-aminopenicillanic acid acyl-transferase
MRSLTWKFLSFSFLLLTPGVVHAHSLPKAEYACNFGNPDPHDRSGESVLYRCRPIASSNAPVLNVAVLKGTPAEVYRAHGYLLAHEAEMGPLKESIDLVKFGISQHSYFLRPTLKSIISCFSNNLFKSLDSGFQANLAAFEEGYRQRLGTAAQYPSAQLRLASTSIELDNIMTAVAYRHGKIGTMLLAEKECPGGLLLKVLLNGGLKLVGKDKGLGCTAFAIPGKNQNGTILSREGLLFGRTLDAELMRSWNKVPTLFVMHEQGRDEKGRPYLSYVATGSAGLIYAGGISGFNTAGIAVSLHQMYAADAVTSVSADEPRRAALAPVVQQTILREAHSIEDAINIANRYQAIATWTILIADAKTGKAAAIEMSEAGVKLVRQTRNQPIVQTNHVFDEEQQNYAFFPTYNKYVETHTRMATLEKAFVRIQRQAAKGNPFDAAQAITQLANHEDINGHFQPFGTTSVKAYDVMSTVMLPQARKIYISAGDFAPSPHATFLGFQLDGRLDPVALLGTLRDQTLAGTPGVSQSMADYVQARLAYEFSDYPEAERLIRRAIINASDEALNNADQAWPDRKAGALRIYNYILARLLAIKATQVPYGHDRSKARLAEAYSESRELFQAVIKDPEVLPYQRALAEYHLALAERKFGNGAVAGLSPETVALVQDALHVFQAEYDQLKVHFEIKEMAENISNARTLLDAVPKRSLKAADIDWVVMR